MNQLLQFINSIHPLSNELIEYLKSILKRKSFDKKSFLLKSGQVCSHIHFIESGLIRCFYLKNDSEVCSWFMKEGDFIVSVESFFYQKESYENIQTLEATVTYCITYSELQHLYKIFPEFNFIGRIIAEKYYSLSEQRLYSIRMHRAKERYEIMMKNSPELIKRIPGNFIASYLSITKETLSRIRARK